MSSNKTPVYYIPTDGSWGNCVGPYVFPRGEVVIHGDGSITDRKGHIVAKLVIGATEAAYAVKRGVHVQ